MTKNISDPIHINGLYAHRGFLSIDEPGALEAVSLPWEIMIREYTLTSTADELGLEQIGRRAGEYKKLFNEQPAETLKQTAKQSTSSRHALLW